MFTNQIGLLYEAIGVLEVWIYDSGKLNIYLLQNQKYIASESSPLFPEIELTKIVPNAIASSWEVGSVAASEDRTR